MNVDDIALSFERGMNAAVTAHLVGVFGSASAVYEASESELVQRAELAPGLARQLRKKNEHGRAEQEIGFMMRNNVLGIAATDEHYPALLLECNDYPHVLYYRGDPEALRATMISMVGTRRANTYGRAVCNRLVGEMARAMPELVIASGLAYGIDIACHNAALDHGLRTICVLAGSATEVYPTVHKKTAEEMIRRGGGILTELSSQDKTSKGRFLQRNRIIAGLSAGTVVVQSPMDGGSMITAGLADGYNRCVMAPPANLGEELSEGTNRLLRLMKARLVCSGADIFEELGWEGAIGSTERPTGPSLEGAEKSVYECICARGKVSLEEIGSATGIALQELLGVLLELEFAGFIRALPGNKYEKSWLG